MREWHLISTAASTAICNSACMRTGKCILSCSPVGGYKEDG